MAHPKLRKEETLAMRRRLIGYVGVNLDQHFIFIVYCYTRVHKEC